MSVWRKLADWLLGDSEKQAPKPDDGAQGAADVHCGALKCAVCGKEATMEIVLLDGGTFPWCEKPCSPTQVEA